MELDYILSCGRRSKSHIKQTHVYFIMASAYTVAFVVHVLQAAGVMDHFEHIGWTEMGSDILHQTI
jgi:hypothetical protein